MNLLLSLNNFVKYFFLGKYAFLEISYRFLDQKHHKSIEIVMKITKAVAVIEKFET